MCEQTEVHYLEGDVVWVKLGACWWPGKVRDVDRLPDDILESFRKKPIAAVQFFNEDKYEYVKNLDQICRYNCRRKNEFIKKGLDMFRAKLKEGSSFMDKFPNDVSMAEELTGGNPEIITDNSFAPEEKPSYRGIFGGEKKPEKKGKISSGSPSKSSPSWRSRITSPSSPTSSVSSPRRPITHPRIIRMLKGEEESHDVRIRQQPVTPERDSSPQNEPYKCYKCDFTSKRLNVVILHSKSHSGESASNGREVKPVSRSKSSGVEIKTTPHRGRGRPRGSHSGSVGRPPKNTPKIQPANSTNSSESSTPKRTASDVGDKEIPDDHAQSNEKKSPKGALFSKRKSLKTPGEKTTKKKKSTEDFKEKLLADWGDEDPEEEEKEMMILKQELSKSGGLSSPTSEGKVEDNINTNSVTDSSNSKRKEMSCFDFDENADSLLDHEFEERAKKFAEARKFPRRLEDKLEVEKKPDNVEVSLDDCKLQDTLPQTVQSKCLPEENKKLQEEFESLMAETELPALPTVPDTTIKIPEREVGAIVSSDFENMEKDVNESLSPVPTETKTEEGAVIVDTVQKTSENDVDNTNDSNLTSSEPVGMRNESSVDLPIKSTNVVSSPKQPVIQIEPCEEHLIEKASETVGFVSEPLMEIPSPIVVKKVDDSSSELQSNITETAQIISEPGSVSEMRPSVMSSDTSQLSLTEDMSQIPLSEQSAQCLPVEEPVQTSLAQQPMHVALAQEASTLTLSPEPSHITISSDPIQMSLSQNSVQLSLEEMDLDINSMPVVMSDTLITDDATAKFNMTTMLPTNSVAITLPPAPVPEKPVIQQIVRKTISSTTSNPVMSPGTVTLNVTPTSEFVNEASTSVVKSSAQTTTANATTKIMKQVVKSVKIQPGSSSNVKASDGSILTAKGAQGTSRYVVIQHSSGKQTIYATTGGKPGQQCVTVKTAASQSQTAQQAIGKKLVIVKSPQGGSVSQEVLSSLQGLSSGGKMVPQRIITSQGTILKQVGRNAPKVMHVTPQQMKALTAGKQVGGTKLTMQSTPTKVVLPTVTKLVSQNQGMKVVASAASAKSKPNTILIQTTQGSSVGSTVVTRALSGTLTVPTSTVQTKLTAVPQGVMRQMVSSARPKLVASGPTSSSGATVQRVVVSTPGRGTVQLQGQTQQKVLAARSSGQPRMLVKAKGGTAVRVPNVGAIAGVQSPVAQIQQVKKVQNVLPRTQIVQKVKQPQVVQKVLTVQQQPSVSSVKATSSTEAIQTIALPSLQPLQPEVSVAPTIQQNYQPNTLMLSQAPTVITQNPTTQSANIAATSAPLMSHEHIAQVVAPTGSDQLGEAGAATYVLVTIDEQGTLQPYDSSNLMTTFDATNPTPENSTRTLYIDPSSLGTSGDLENIFLAINNSASGGSGTLLNLGQTAVSGTNISTTQHSQSVFNIADSQPTASVGSQDILAAALANTDVFQSDGSMSDSLTVVNSTQSAGGSVMTSRLLEPSSILPTSSSTTLHQTTVLLPTLTGSAMPPPNTAGVLETSLTLNQPIMSPLEVPSSVSNLQQPPPPIPTSLELPLTITQPVLSMASTSQYSTLSHESNSIQDAEVVESPISSSSVSLPTSHAARTSRTTLQPSMPLLSEDVSESQAAIASDTSVHTAVIDCQPENAFDSSAQSSVAGEPETCIVTGTTCSSEEVVLPTYAQVPEVSSHDGVEQGSAVNEGAFESNPGNELVLTDQGLSTSYHEVPESTSEASTTLVQVPLELTETQTASEQTVSTSYAKTLLDPVPKERAEMIDSSNPPMTENTVPNYSVENSSEAVAVKEVTSAQEITVAEETCIPYEQVESTSQLQESVKEVVAEVEHSLPSESDNIQPYAPTPESTSSVSSDVLESNTSGTFALPSYSQTPESTCELQEEKEISPNQSTSASYSQVPESTSHMTETSVVGDSPIDVLDSSQHSLDSSVLTPYQVPESSSEASMVSYDDTHSASAGNPPNSNQSGYASCTQVPESTSHMQDVLTFSDSSTEVSDCAVPLPQSMPLLLDTGSGSIATKRHIEGEEHNTNDMDHSKRVKIDETERIKDQVPSSSCPHPTPDSVSLQCGDETIYIDDDELPSPCYPPSSLNQKIFARDDIVWMKVNKVYIPGVVIRADKKLRTAKVKCINSPRIEKAFSKRFTDLLDFNNHTRNQQLLEESRRVNPTVQNAFDKITEYWCLNCVAEKPISAARYLTYHENDKLYGAPLSPEANQVVMEERQVSDPEREDNRTPLKSRDVTTILECDEIQDNADLVKQMRQESEKLMRIIESSECEEHLRNIFTGFAACKRHKLFMTKKIMIQRNLISDSGLGPFDEEEMGINMVSTIDSILRKIDENDFISTCGSRKDYLFHVLIPEEGKESAKAMGVNSNRTSNERGLQSGLNPIALAPSSDQSPTWNDT